MKKISFVLLLLHWLTAATAQQPYSKAVKEQIARVETSLSGGLVFDGKTCTLSQQGKLDLYQDINQYFLSKGLASEPSDSSLVKNLAHSFLFKGDFTKAIELYRQYLKSGDNANELIKSLKDDFEYFRNAGFDHSVIKKASETLSL
jgi:hypothetical protein